MTGPDLTLREAVALHDTLFALRNACDDEEWANYAVGRVQTINRAMAKLGEWIAAQAPSRRSDPNIQAKLRETLKEATDRGVVTGFALRPGGRATVAVADGKYYTKNTLETLALLSQLERKAEEAKASTG